MSRTPSAARRGSSRTAIDISRVAALAGRRPRTRPAPPRAVRGRRRPRVVVGRLGLGPLRRSRRVPMAGAALDAGSAAVDSGSGQVRRPAAPPRSSKAASAPIAASSRSCAPAARSASPAAASVSASMSIAIGRRRCGLPAGSRRARVARRVGRPWRHSVSARSSAERIESRRPASPPSASQRGEAPREPCPRPGRAARRRAARGRGPARRR